METQFRPTGFSILPTVVKNLLIINGIAFLAMIALDNVWHIDLTDTLGLHYIGASDFHPYQFVTYMFMHGSFTHLFFNMFALWMFGNTLENLWGSQRFLVFYFVCGIGAGLIQELVQYIQFVATLDGYDSVRISANHVIPMAEYLNMMTTVGASGAVYGLLLAFGMMFPNSMIYLYFAIPIKAKWFVIGYAAIELFSGLGSNDNVAHFAHLGGMLFGLILILYWRKGDNGFRDFFNSIFDKISSLFRKRSHVNTNYRYGRPKTDEQFNKERADDQAKMDNILEKIAKRGYASLSEEEKDFLFKQSKK